MTEGLIAATRREVSRCRAALAGGSPHAFWQRRLQRAALALRAALGLIEQQLVEMGAIEYPAPRGVEQPGSSAGS